MKSFIKRVRCIAPIAFLLMLLLASCSKSDDQKEFEDRAYSAPSGITETTLDPQEDPISVDPDDWQISPMYRGFIQFETLPRPNPVVRNSEFRFDLNVTGIESVPGLFIYIYDALNDRLLQEIYRETDSLPTGALSVIIDTSAFPQTAPDNLYRILLLDSRQNVISYGDIELQ
ncbi:MAG: hypothetical protein R3224_02710 [Balneolaceae bacterium]|nr:hypothetical protein [Balneolaceae bacterium]